jgi:hypothetical protein
MEVLYLLFATLFAAELLILCLNISKLRSELSESQKKLASGLSEIRKLLEKKADKA